MGALEPQRIQRGLDAGGDPSCCGGHLLGKLGRLPETGHVHRDRVVVLGEALEHGLPNASVCAQGVHAHQRLAASEPVVGKDRRGHRNTKYGS